MKFKSNKQKFVIVGIILLLLFIIGSFINFYTMNLFTLTIMEKKSPAFYLTLFTWMAGHSIAIEFIIGFIFTIRSLLQPNVFKKMVHTYSIIILSISILAIISSLISGIVKYGSMLKPYPFPGFHIITLIFHILIVALAILCLTYFKKIIPNDLESKKIKVSYVWETIGFVFVCLIFFNRFGALMWAPVYGTTTIYGKLVPFYVFLFLPILIFAHGIVYVLGGYKYNVRLCRILSCILLILTLCLFAIIVAFEITDPLFVSRISMAMAIERASTTPADTILMGITIPGSIIGLTIEQFIKSNIRVKQGNLVEKNMKVHKKFH